MMGTRPEAIKLCPLIQSMEKHSDLRPHVCITGQHREMLDQVLTVFNVTPDVQLSLMQPNQTLGGLTSRAIAAIDDYLDTYKPDMMIVQGDTTTVLSASLCAFYHQIPIAHVEAGLRTWNKHSPYPEEINRVLTSRLSDIHFTPTQISRNNLIREGVDHEKIFVTGNTVIDALLAAVEKVKINPPNIPGLNQSLIDSNRPMVLITGHRRENFGDGFDNICEAILELSRRFSDTIFVYPVHLNPNVKQPVHEKLHGAHNIHLIEPIDYLQFVWLMNRSKLILTDSGGVQEEAPSLGKPVLVMRDTTERPEAIDCGAARLVGTKYQSIVDQVSLLLEQDETYKMMAKAVNPYGDGTACQKIIEVLKN